MCVLCAFPVIYFYDDFGHGALAILITRMITESHLGIIGSMSHGKLEYPTYLLSIYPEPCLISNSYMHNVFCGTKQTVDIMRHGQGNCYV